MEHEIKTFRQVKRDSIRIAKQLEYGKIIVEKLNEAEAVEDLDRILRTARQNSEECPPNGYFKY